jgi:hypothetical protein
MSLAALALVLFHIAAVGTAPQGDEGIEAHLFQILIAGQVPFLVYYAVRWLPRDPKTAVLVIGVQLAAAVGAIAPVYLLRW